VGSEMCIRDSYYMRRIYVDFIHNFTGFASVAIENISTYLR